MFIKKSRQAAFITILMAVAVIGMLAGCSAKTATSSAGTDNVEWAFTRADQHPEQLLVEVMNGAEKYLDVAIYSLTYPDVVKAIREAHKRGVAVRIITDSIQSGGKTQAEALKILGAAGIPIKINSHSGLMHLKMTIADRKVATTGSFNYSKAASTVNDEILMVLRDEKVAKSFSDEFESMWNDSAKFASYKSDGKAEASGGDKSKKAADEAYSDERNDPTAATGREDSEVSANCPNPEIKGNINSKKDKIYHLPGGANYDKTVAERMFCTAEEAEAAGFRAARN